MKERLACSAPARMMGLRLLVAILTTPVVLLETQRFHEHDITEGVTT
jgi:hypothetical protein